MFALDIRQPGGLEFFDRRLHRRQLNASVARPALVSGIQLTAPDSNTGSPVPAMSTPGGEPPATGIPQAVFRRHAGA